MIYTSISRFPHTMIPMERTIHSIVTKPETKQQLN